MIAVLTVDQQRSRADCDRVPDAISGLAAHALLRPFERTAGDEFQGVLDDPELLPSLLEPLLRESRWSIGLGFGPVEEPLAATARAGRGEAYLVARDAVTAAKRGPWHVRVRGPEPSSRALETALWLWAGLLSRRSPQGWEVADLVSDGTSYGEAARRLGISQSAVSQRAQAAGLVEGRRAGELVTHLGGILLGRSGSAS